MYDIDLYEAGDRLLSIPVSAKESRQTESRPTSTPYKELRLLIEKSGWNKPTIQLAMCLGLEAKGNLTVGGLRRLHQLMKHCSIPVQCAAASRSHIANDPRFWALREWVNRPYSFRAFRKKEKRRIGVGYRDKGTLPPPHQQGRDMPEPGAIYLGEKMEYIWTLEPRVALMVQDYGYLLSQIPTETGRNSGWWIPDHRLRYLMVTRSLLN